ncbi:MAG: imidazoleglycerol-phosphate dehydratase HisB [Lachnospiraceae bacterium]|nr:imidazoleglycerol-phosphate dehydratase HisB [Lachnospiraceae bacterium]
MREATINRKTKETDITLSLDLDGKGISEIDTGIGFLDHMLTGFAKHSFIDLKVKCKGDLNVDGHHTTEDIGICLGAALKQAIGDKAGINRYGYFIMPMDDALILSSVDLCDRPYFNYDLKIPSYKVGELETELVREFFYAVSYSGGMNLHLKQLDGINSHHIIEAAFKAFAKAISQAVSLNPKVEGTLSSKGSLNML